MWPIQSSLYKQNKILYLPIHLKFCLENKFRDCSTLSVINFSVLRDTEPKQSVHTDRILCHYQQVVDQDCAHAEYPPTAVSIQISKAH